MAETGASRLISASGAAELLGVPEATVRDLLRAGLLAAAGPTRDQVALSDVKAFLARNASESPADGDDGDAGEPWSALEGSELDDVDPTSLLAGLGSDDLARSALERLITVAPDAGTWAPERQQRFIEEARDRLDAILSVITADRLDDAVLDELEAVGAEAAESGTALPHVLLVLRISRDLVVQAAVEAAEARRGRWALALSLLLTRIVPTFDRLADAVARGYWLAALERSHAQQARYANVVEHATDGVYEVGKDGRVIYANQALATMLGRRRSELVGRSLPELLGIEAAEAAAADDQEVEIWVSRPDGVARRLGIHRLERRAGSGAIGHDGVVRDLTAQRQFEALKDDLLELLSRSFRKPLTTVQGLGATLAEHGDELGGARVQTIGERIRQQADELGRLADELVEASHLQYDSVVLVPRPVPVAAAVRAALATVPTASDVVIEVPAEAVVLADHLPLERVIANLIDNALRYGEPPVVVSATMDGEQVAIEVRDHGLGVPAELVPRLFSELRPQAGRPAPSKRGGESSRDLGLALVRALVEEMGGRVWYRTTARGGAFGFSLPAAGQ